MDHTFRGGCALETWHIRQQPHSANRERGLLPQVYDVLIRPQPAGPPMTYHPPPLIYLYCTPVYVLNPHVLFIAHFQFCTCVILGCRAFSVQYAAEEGC